MSRRRRVFRVTVWSLTLLALSIIGASVQQQGKVSVPTAGSQPPGFYEVSNVVDGDTIDVNIAGRRETVRLIGIDTPELKDPRKPVQCFAEAASNRAHQLLDDKSVRLEADPENSDRDKYQRLLRYAYLQDGTFVNEKLVREGYAFAYTVFANSKLEDFRAWEKEARENDRGLWAGCSVDESSKVKQTVGR